ncbi:MAG: gamma-glutamyltransferase, partial [Ornithinimicrobium sp.]
MTFTTRPTLQGTFGMVSSTHWIASGAAMGILERGGNAFDAAVCAGFVLHVVEPHLNGPGGDLPAIVSDASGAGAQVLCGQGPAPAAATAAHFVAAGM